MKTLTELNSKWWWRLIKVIYLILMVLLSIFWLFLIYTTLQDNPYKENTDYSLTKSDPQLEEIMSQINFEHLSPDQEKYFEEIKPKIHEELKSISVNFSDLKKDFKVDIFRLMDLASIPCSFKLASQLRTNVDFICGRGVSPKVNCIKSKKETKSFW